MQANVINRGHLFVQRPFLVCVWGVGGEGGVNINTVGRNMHFKMDGGN